MHARVFHSIEQTYISKTSKKRQNCKQVCGASTKSLSPEPTQSTIAKAGADWNARRALQGKETWLTSELLTISRVSAPA